MDIFTKAYLECALWSSIDDNDDPFDKNYSIEDIAPEDVKKMEADCAKFQAENHVTSEQAGHDFWLTRQHHGAGFWDGDWPEPQAAQLTEASHQFKETYLYVGDDGLIHCD